LADVLLRDDDNYVRRKAAEALGKIGDPYALESLIKALLNDNDWRVRWGAAEAMGAIGDPSTVESLIYALEDDEWPVRWMAAKALGRIGDPRAVRPLIKALEGDWPALWTVAEALGQLEDPHAVGPLVAVLRDSYSDKYVQHTAVEALGQLGEPVQKPLIILLRDGDEGARQRAIAALGQLGDVRNLAPLIAALRDEKWPVHDGARKALMQIGKAAVEPLLAVLQDDDPFVRRRAVLALGEIRDVRALESLIAVLEGDETPLVRREAARALRRMDTPEAWAALREYEERASRAVTIPLPRRFPLY
jgi:HEAT repeat protein